VGQQNTDQLQLLREGGKKNMKTKFLRPGFCGQIKEIPTQTQARPLSRVLPRTLISFTLFFASFVCHAKKTSSLLQTSVSEKMLCAATKYRNSKLEAIKRRTLETFSLSKRLA
jgi:hypothetical protein